MTVCRNSLDLALEFVFPLGLVHLGRCERNRCTQMLTKSVLNKCRLFNSGAAFRFVLSALRLILTVADDEKNAVMNLFFFAFGPNEQNTLNIF